jgi:hypothetical protein
MIPIETALYSDPRYLRLFYRVKGSSISFLDSIHGAGWRHWPVDKILHWSSFRSQLLYTRRAGLHIVNRWRNDQGVECYVSNANVDRDGIYVMMPGLAVTPCVAIDDAVSNPLERHLLLQCLLSRFHVDCGRTANPAGVLRRLADIDPALDSKARQTEIAAA